MVLKEDVILDLHIHSTASDGTYSPEKIVQEAAKKGIGLISLTDHDDIKNVKDTEKFAEDKGIAFLPGIEVSSTLEGELFHILAYGTDNTNKELLELLEHNRYLLGKKDDDSIKYLVEKGYDIDYLKYEKYEHDNARGGWKALNFLIDEKLCIDVKDYFTRLFCEENGIKFPKFSNTEEVIKIIKKANGVPVLAHPYYSKDDTTVFDKLDKFLRMGIEGVECFHPHHNEQITQLCLEWCRKNNVIITAGSDFHGGFIEERSMGNPKVIIKEVNLGRLEEHIKFKILSLR